MTRIASLLPLLALAGCGTTWQALDADGDGITRQDGDCWDASAGPAGSGLQGSDIHPGATETWYDGVDQNCDGRDDYDQDGDGYVPAGSAGLATLGVAGSGGLPEGDCWDDPADLSAEHTTVSNELRDASGRQVAWTQPTAVEVHPDVADTWYDGVDQDCDGADDFDQDGDSWRTAAYPDQAGEFGEDCIDGADLDAANPAGLAAAEVHPEAAETWYDGTDQDCDGTSDADQDGDGDDATSAGGTDCDDTDGSIHPGATETWYDGIDQTCDANDGDADGDGYWVEDYEARVSAAGGTPLPVPEGFEGDCDDGDSAIHPGATERWYDGTDQDCDGASDYDQDGDGYDATAAGGDDCDDTDGTVNPGAMESWYDGVDQDCDGASDYDADRDGYDTVAAGGTDCDDTAWDVNPGATEAWYDGVDQDCDGASDYDADQDGHDALDWGGDDCDDADSASFPGAPEVWYDGVDQDCDGASDYDADRDGHDSVDWGGDDCDDTDAGVNPDEAEDFDGVDDDCDGLVDNLGVDIAATGWLDGLAGDALGAPPSLATGDLNGDGQLEILVGSALEEAGRGLVWIVGGGSPASLHDTAASVAALAAGGQVASGYLAVMDPVLADLGGDGQVDLALAGTDLYDPSNVAVALWDGGPGFPTTATPLNARLALTGAEGGQAGRISAHLDVDGDGVAELVFGDWSSPSETAVGPSTVYLVETPGLSGTMDLATACPVGLYGVDPGAELGHSLGGGDLDGDGYDDLLIGAPGSDAAAGSDAGEIAVFLGPDPQLDWGWDDFSTYADLLVQGGAAGAQLGEGGFAVCDPDADGAMDLAIGDPGADAVHLFLAAGGYSGTHDLGEADLTLTGEPASRFGQALDVGDFDGDGVDDLSIGAPGATDPTSPSATWDGAAYLFTGPGITAGGSPAPMASLLDSSAGLLGLALLAADLDADGRSDLVVAAPGTADAAGRAWLVVMP
jgi:hypothetical protein